MNKSKIISLADKLLIKLNDDEIEMLESEFSDIEKSVNLINEIEGISEVLPMHMIPYTDKVYLREDEPKTSLTKEEIIKNCGDSLDDQVKVPRVVEEE